MTTIELGNKKVSHKAGPSAAAKGAGSRIAFDSGQMTESRKLGNIHSLKQYSLHPTCHTANRLVDEIEIG